MPKEMQDYKCYNTCAECPKIFSCPGNHISKKLHISNNNQFNRPSKTRFKLQASSSIPQIDNAQIANKPKELVCLSNLNDNLFRWIAINRNI